MCVCVSVCVKTVVASSLHFSLILGSLSFHLIKCQHPMFGDMFSYVKLNRLLIKAMLYSFVNVILVMYMLPFKQPQNN